jgi:hypothetical protein
MTRPTFQRYLRAILGGWFIIAAAGGITIATLLATHHASPHKWEYLEGFFGLGPIAAAAAAGVGAAVRKSGRAAAYGVILFGVVAAQCVWIVGREIGPWREQLWLWAAAVALGGLIGGAGAVLARTVAEPGEKAHPLQFTLQELLIVCTLLAVMLGYFAHFVQE